MIKWIKKNRLGFTLVKLMIVIAILGILTAVVINTYNEYSSRIDKPTTQTENPLENLP